MATDAVFKKMPLVGTFNIVFGIVGLVVSLILCFVFLPLGLICLFGAIIFLAVGIKGVQGAWIGSCPYCGRPKVEISKEPGAANCPKCKQRVICDNGAFYTLKEISER